MTISDTVATALGNIETPDELSRGASSNDVRVQQALKAIAGRYKHYLLYNNYYNGIQSLTYQSEKYRNAFAGMVSKFRENMCATVIDALADRLSILSFEVEGTDNDEQGKTLWTDVWDANNMDLQAGDVHAEALRAGDAYVIVWPDQVTDEVIIVPQDACDIYVHYADDSITIDWAAKWWIDDDKHARVNIYGTDRIEKWISQGTVRSNLPQVNVRFIPAPDAVVPNPYSRVPVFHFANNALYKPGKSDLRDVMTLQDALNKSVADLLVGMEFSAFAQRWATGLELVTDPATGKPAPTFTPGQERLWFSESKDTTFGQFDPSPIEKMISTHDMFVTSIARVTGTPIHYMLIDTANFPSGESLKTAEARFIAKVRDRQIAFGAIWEQVLTFAAEIKSITLTGRVTAAWMPAAPRSEREGAEVGVLKKQVGVSNEQIQREMGYTDDQIENMQKERDEEAERSLERNMMALSRGAIGDTDPSGEGQ